MKNSRLEEARYAHDQIMKSMLDGIDVPVLDHIALEMAAKRRYLKNSMPGHFSSNYLNVGLISGFLMSVFLWTVTGSFWVGVLFAASSYILLHRRMLWLMDRFYFMARTPRFLRLTTEAARGLYAPHVKDSGYDEKFIKPILLRYLNGSRVTGLEFWNLVVEMAYAFRPDFHDSKMDISEVDSLFAEGDVEAIIAQSPYFSEVRENDAPSTPAKVYGSVSVAPTVLDQEQGQPSERPAKLNKIDNNRLRENKNNSGNSDQQSKIDANDPGESLKKDEMEVAAKPGLVSLLGSASLSDQSNESGDADRLETSVSTNETSSSTEGTSSSDEAESPTDVSSAPSQAEEPVEAPDFEVPDFGSEDDSEGDAMDFEPDDAFGFDEIHSDFDNDDEDGGDTDFYDALSSEVVAESGDTR